MGVEGLLGEFEFVGLLVGFMGLELWRSGEWPFDGSIFRTMFLNLSSWLLRNDIFESVIYLNKN